MRKTDGLKLVNAVLLLVIQKEDVKTKYTNVYKTLHNEYYKSDFDGKTKLLFGSDKPKTNTRPLSEMQNVDVIFKITQETYIETKQKREYSRPEFRRYLKTKNLHGLTKK